MKTHISVFATAVITTSAAAAGSAFAGEIAITDGANPAFSPDGTRIVLDIVPTVVFPPEWRDYPAAPLAPGGAATALPEPFFPVFSLALSLDVKRGNTVALGGALLAEPGKGERFQLFFVNADVVDLDGVPIPAP